MAFCSNCGHKLDNNDKFCPNCGASCDDTIDKVKDKLNYNKSTSINLSNDDKSQEVYSDSGGKYPQFDSRSDNHHTQSNKNSKESFNVLFCIVGIVIAIIIVFGVMSLFTGGGNTTINGVNFNIPNGLEAGETQNYIKQGHECTEVTYKEKGGIRSINIQIIDDYQPNTKNKNTETIHGHTGVKSEQVSYSGAFVEQFTYNVDNKYIIVTTGNMEVDEVIV